VSLFATEFFLDDSVDRTAFLDETRIWVEGMKHTRLFQAGCQETVDGDNISHVAPNGETLMIRCLQHDNGLVAIGCRHDLPDDKGLNWRTEAVMRRTEKGNLLRVRAQCVPIRPLAVPETPKRTHLIRSLIEHGRVASDGPLPVSTAPHRPAADSLAQDLAGEIAMGTAALSLPVVYVSVRDDGTPALTETEVSHLARMLCGIAHVIVEPTRSFSFKLRDLSGGRNVYGGTIGISVPGRGFVRRMYLGGSFPDSAALAEAVRRAATEVRTALSGQGGWEWHDLQEQILVDQRAREKSREDSGRLDPGMEALYEAELKEKNDRISELTAQLAGLRAAHDALVVESERSSTLPDLDMAEVYVGEIADRLRAAALQALEKPKDRGWDDRSIAVFRTLVARPVSPGLQELQRDLERATRDPKKSAGALQSLLSRHGYVFKSNNGHPRMEAGDDFPGLGSVTLSTSPSDVKAGKNMKSDIAGCLGLKKLQ
jgi:hypothetical protein